MEKPLPNGAATVLHPLRYFPSSNDKMLKTWTRPRVRKYKRGEPWLNAGKLDASFGVRPASPEPQELRKIELARSYRRIQSSRMFRTMSRGAVSLTELFPRVSNNQQDSDFVLVNRKQLRHISQLEEQLKDEEQFLGEQCTWMLNEKQESARMPLPYIRIAVRCICEKEMHRYQQAIAELEGGWLEHIKEQRYARPPEMNMKVLHPMQPHSARVIALKRYTEKVKMQRELQCMNHEDLLSSLTDRYVDAEERMLDYEQYFVLATRYGPLSEDEWLIDPRPGRRYFNKAHRSAVLFQRVWGCYWPRHHFRRFKAAKSIQTRLRGYRCRARWGILIRLRSKYGPRSYLRQTWKEWKLFVLKIKRVKRMLCFNLDKFERAIFLKWKEWATAQHAQRTKSLQWFVGGEKSRRLLRIVLAWRKYTDRAVWVKNIYRRSVQKPQFQRWRENVIEIRRFKAAQAIAIKCQHWWHMYRVRSRFRQMQAALKQIRRLVACRVDMIRYRKARRARQDARYEQYKLQAVEVEMLAAMENERKRMLKLQEVMRTFERQMMKELNSHFERNHGRNQLQIQAKQIADVLNTVHPTFSLTRALHKQSNSFAESVLKHQDRLFWTLPVNPISAEGINTRKLPEYVHRELLERGKRLFRSIARHDYLGKAAPRYSCAYPGCNSVFLTAEQYSEHIANNCAASSYNLGDFSTFHSLLRDPYGKKMVRVFAVSTGMNSVANTLELYLGIQDWRKDAFDTSQYETHAIALFDSYISGSGHFRTECIEPEMREKLGSVIERVRLKEYEGFYQLFSVKGASVTIENLKAHGPSVLANRTHGHEFWCPDHVIDPNIFDNVEWAAFIDIYRKLAADFFRSKFASQHNEHSELLVGIRADRTREEWDRRTSAERIRDAAKFKRQQAEIQEVCKKTTHIVLQNVFCEYYLQELINQEVAKHVAELAYREQAEYEPICAVADELVWVIMEECLEKSVSSAMKNKDLVADMKAFWQELQVANLDVSKVVRIQAWFRGLLSRKITRKHLATRIMKLYDPNSGMYYYFDTELQQSVWEKPKLLQRLFAFSNASKF